jgi:NADPH-dependent glutamate synthase beta subunit-like oxidoreductase
MEEVPGSEKFFPAQLVFLALGFLGPQSDVIKALEVKQDARSNIQTPTKVRFIVTCSSHFNQSFIFRVICRTSREYLLQETVAVGNH